MGLHRLTERFDEVVAGEELVVRTRAAAAATDRGRAGHLPVGAAGAGRWR